MSKKILIADDEYDIRFMLEQLLRLEGFDTVSVGDGRQALNVLQEQDFDLLLLDVMMPEIDGFGVLKELDASKLDTMKIVILSAKAADEDIIRGYTVGVSQYITKPFDNDYVVDIVRYLVGDLDEQERAQIEKRIKAQ